MHENYEEFISLTLRTRNSKTPSWMLARNWKHHLLLVCFARHARTVRMCGLVVNPMRSNQNLRVTWKPVNPPECVSKNLYRVIMKTILQEKGENSSQHCNLVYKFIPVPQALKNSFGKSSSGQGMGKIGENFRRGTWQKSEVKRRWSMKQGRRAQKFILLHWWTSDIKKCWIGGKAPKIQRSSCTPWWYCKRRFWVFCSIHWTRIISISNDSSKSHGYHLQIVGLRWTSSRRSISLYPSENGRCSTIIENLKIGMSRHLDSSTTTQMAKIMVQFGRPSRSYWAKSVWSAFGWTVMRKAIWENPFETWLGENSKLGMSLCSSWKRINLICVCGWHKIGWKETKSWSDVETI